MIRLNQRVERLERDLPADKTEIFNDALNHPASALLIKKTIINSATTDDDEKHEILAELIAQRLTANADDMIALAGAAACNIVNFLSSRQIKILAILTTIKDIRPLQIPMIPEPALAKQFISTWWSNNLDLLLKDDVTRSATSLDYEHLAAMGCIRISIGLAALMDLISLKVINPEIKFSESEFKGQAWYEALESQWEFMGHSTTTSVGRLIGVLYKDAKLKSNTQIKW